MDTYRKNPVLNRVVRFDLIHMYILRLADAMHPVKRLRLPEKFHE